VFLANDQKLIFDAYKNQKAIGAFNVHDLEIFEAVVKAANDEKSPVIVQITPLTLEYFSPAYFMALVKVAQDLYPNTTVAMHLDHGKNSKQILECLEAGFSSVMIDAADKSLSENIKLTRKVVKMARRFRAAVEAEVGEMPNHHGSPKEVTARTITDAQEFIKKTGIDFLAMPFGTHHGMEGPEGIEHINFEHLKFIHEQIKIPLVLHGASGVSRNELKRARLYGIAKVNFDTAIRKIFTNTLRKYLKANPEIEDLRIYLNEASKSVEKLVKSKIKALYS